jgi:N utilization substance protein A
MKGKEILRLVDSLHRNKDIDSEVIFQAIERALQSAARKNFGSSGEISIQIDRESGEVEAFVDEERVEPEELGRIAAQTAKQVMMQSIRQAESEIIYQEYEEQKGDLVTGMVQRHDGGSIVVKLDKTEGILPRSEQIPGEHYQPGERLRAIILDVRKSGERTTIVLSRTHPDFVRRLFEIEVPEVAEGVVVMRGIAREPGERTKVAMESLEPHVDCVGACVGVRGTRIKSIIDELNGEKIDIIPWREAPEMLIADSLKPAEILQMTLEEGEGTKRAIVVVPEDELALAIGRKGQNVRLAVKLTGWDIDIRAPENRDEGEAGGADTATPENKEVESDDKSTPDVEHVGEDAGDENLPVDNSSSEATEAMPEEDESVESRDESSSAAV